MILRDFPAPLEVGDPISILCPKNISLPLQVKKQNLQLGAKEEKHEKGPPGQKIAQGNSVKYVKPQKM